MLPGAGQTFRGQRAEGEPACHYSDTFEVIRQARVCPFAIADPFGGGV